MRRVVAAVLGCALVVATAAPSWADAVEFRLPNAVPHGGPGNGPGQRTNPQRFTMPNGGDGGGARVGGAGPGGDGFGGPQRRFNAPGQQFGGQGPRFGGQGPRFGGQGQPFGGQGQRFGGGPVDGGRDFGRRGGFRRHGYGAGIGAGVAGLAAGAVIGGALANRYAYDGYNRDDDNYGDVDPVYGAPAYAPDADDDITTAAADDPASCAQRYRSYDIESQTYLGYDGRRHPCP